MKAPITPAQSLLQPRAVAHIPLDWVERHALQTSHIRSGAQQRLHMVSASDKLMHKIRSNEPGSARHEAIHALMILQPSVGSTPFSTPQIFPSLVSVIYRTLQL